MELITSFLRNFTPTTIAMSGDVSDEFLIFLRGPKPSLNLLLIAARMVSHTDRSRISILSRLLVAMSKVFFFSFIFLVFYPKWLGSDS